LTSFSPQTERKQVLLLSTQHGGENRRSKRRGCAIFLLVLDFAEELSAREHHASRRL
jgi:hypothetical protein